MPVEAGRARCDLLLQDRSTRRCGGLDGGGDRRRWRSGTVLNAPPRGERSGNNRDELVRARVANPQGVANLNHHPPERRWIIDSGGRRNRDRKGAGRLPKAARRRGILDFDPGTSRSEPVPHLPPARARGHGGGVRGGNIRTGRTGRGEARSAPDSKAKASAVARFRQEARAAGSINSDHVTQVLDVEEDAEHGVVLVFELLEGESLIDRLKRTGPIPFDELYPIIEQVWLGPRRRAPRRDHPPRPQAVERLPRAAARRHDAREDPRLRHLQAAEGDGRRDAHRDGAEPRHVLVHAARADRQGEDGRPPRRHLRVRHADLPVAHRAAPVRGAQHPGHGRDEVEDRRAQARRGDDGRGSTRGSRPS